MRRRTFIAGLAGAVASPLPAPGQHASSQPPSTPPPATKITLQKLMGPVLPGAKLSALGPLYAKYVRNFDIYHAKQFAYATANPGEGIWAQLNYYDRAYILYAWREMTGQQKYLDHARFIALDYRLKYLEPNAYNSSPHWAMMKGVAAHHLDTGDEASRKAVGQVADLYAGWGSFNKLSTGDIDTRIKARHLELFILAAVTDAPSTGTAGGFPGGNDWTARAREALTRILSSQLEDGSYRSTWDQDAARDGSGPTIRPFMEGMLNDAMILYHRLAEQDARILPAIKRNVECLWNTCWNPARKAFLYNSKETVGEPGSAVPAPDLNGLVIGGFAWVHRQAGDTSDGDKAKLILEGGIAGAYVAGMKQFNQHYTSWAALPLIHG